jgi:hypothetical protein
MTDNPPRAPLPQPATCPECGSPDKVRRLHQVNYLPPAECIHPWHAAAVPQPPAQPGAPTRTPQDYAIEHGGYLADRAQQYLDARNRYDIAVAGYADAVAGYADEGEVPNSDELSDCHQALRSAIFEFRKRREWAEAEAVVQPPDVNQDWRAEFEKWFRGHYPSATRSTTDMEFVLKGGIAR